MLAVIDLETTGLNAGSHEIVEISLMIVDSKTLKEVSRFTSMVKPRRLTLVSDKAMKVNGLKFADLAKAPTSEVVRGRIYEWIEDLNLKSKLTPCGYNYSFDGKFLELFFGKIEYGYLFKYWHIDVKTMAWERWWKDELGEVSDAVHLTEVAEHYNLVHKAHDAFGDVYVTAELLRIFLDGREV